MGTLVAFHAHPDDESISTGGIPGAGQRRGASRRPGVATNGDYGEVPDDLADGETLVDRRRAETARVGRRRSASTASCGSATRTAG